MPVTGDNSPFQDNMQITFQEKLIQCCWRTAEIISGKKVCFTSSFRDCINQHARDSETLFGKKQNKIQPHFSKVLMWRILTTEY